MSSENRRFTITISKNSIISTDVRFTMGNLSLGDLYEPLDAYFKKSNGKIIKRENQPNEKVISNRTLPRLVCQIFERELLALSE